MTASTKTCPYCMGEIPSAAVKCMHCREFVNGQAQPAAVNAGWPSPACAALTGAAKDYSMLPWYRRGSVMGQMVWIGLLICSPLLVPLAIASATGDIYRKPKEGEHELVAWPRWNRVFLIVVAILWAAFVVFWLTVVFPEQRHK